MFNDNNTNMKRIADSLSILKQKARFFNDGVSLIHIALKNGRFYNGKILELRTDFMIIKDLKLGEIPVFFSEMLGINRYQEEGK